MASLLQVTGLTKVYGKRGAATRALDGVDLSLEAGDALDVAVVSTSGTVSVNIQKEGAPPLYAREDVPTGQFSLEIPEDGEYNITVTGEQARGSVSFVRRDNSGL